jgi:pyrroloquinoline quinone biosynthesis protein D
LSSLERDRILKLAPGCRLNSVPGQEDVLLIPEGAMQMKGPARTIIALCDGTRTFDALTEELKRLYPMADAARIESETAALLDQLRDRGILEYG